MATMGTTTMTPAKSQMMNRKKMANGRSIRVETVAEVKNSRTDSNSCRCLANAPVDAGRDSIFIPITLAKILADSSTSDFLPAMSMK